MSAPIAATPRAGMPRNAAPVVLGRVSLWHTGRVLLRMSWARTITPVLLIAMLGLIALPMLFALVFASRGALSGDPVPFLMQRYDQLVCALATPVIALLLGTSAFSAESDDGTLLYLVTTTTPRWWITLVRVAFASVGTAVMSALAVWATGKIATGANDPQDVTRAFTLATAFGGATYAALFTTLSLATRRSLVAGLMYVLIWEGILSTTFPAIHYLSVRQWMLVVAHHFIDSADKVAMPGPSFTASLIGAGVVFVMAILVGAQRLQRPRLSRVGT